MNYKFCFIAAAICFWIGTVRADAQGHPGQLDGRVINAGNNLPISNLKIKVIGVAGPDRKTDQNGRYQFALPPGTYKVIIDDAEYGEHRKTITIRSGRTTVSNIRALPLASPRH
jgi:hypothetical protein